MAIERIVYRELAGSIDARIRCGERGDDNSTRWYQRHTVYAKRIMKAFAPSGSGIDAGTHLDLDRSTGEKLVFTTSYHHMDENGSYDGWTEHDVIVKASLIFGLDIKITGRDRNDIKDYLHDVFGAFLRRVFTEEQATEFMGHED